MNNRNSTEFFDPDFYKKALSFCKSFIKKRGGREEVLQKNIHKPFSLISAPAGYGKSMAVSQWLEQCTQLYTWLSLDEDHNDLRTFLLYLCAAIEKIFPGSLEISSSLIQSPVLPRLKAISNSLINDLDMIKQNI